MSAVLLAGLVLGGCTRDDLDDGGGSAFGSMSGGMLALEIEAPAMGDGPTISSAPGNNLENYINERDLRILFFDKNETFSFELSKHYNEGFDNIKSGYSIEPLGSSDGINTKWFVRIPLNQLDDDQLDLIFNRGFKIAVFANWNDDATFEYTNFADPDNTDFQLSSHLAHCYVDNAYTRAADTREAYEPFLGPQEDGEYSLMGVSQDWVVTHYEDVAAADASIRSSYQPYPDDGRPYMISEGGHLYHKMWYVWNFGGSANSEIETPSDAHPYYDTPDTPDETIKKAWIQRNDEIGWAQVLQGLKENPASSTDYIPGVKVYSGSSPLRSGEHDGVIFASKENSDNYTAVETKYGLGFMMPRMSSDTWAKHDSGAQDLFTDISESDIKSGATNSGYGYLKIPLAADGTLRFKIGAICGSGDNHNVSLGLHYDAVSSSASTNKSRRTYYTVIEEEEGENNSVYFAEGEFSVSITERVKNAYIYALCTNANDRLVIYEIEYIKAQHLADVDRDGINISKENPIPMYGVQDFGPVGNYLVPDELFNLSDESQNPHSPKGYNYQSVGLLRSVAKATVYLSKAAFPEKPSYIFMRSMNRSARCYPIDVATPTDKLWNGGTYVKNDSPNGTLRLSGIETEVENIKSYGTMYEKDYKGDLLEHFQSRLSWFFQVWHSDWQWDWNGNTKIYAPTGLPAPRIFNPHINRSDYTHFREMESDEPGYWCYELYVPEKHITDANKVGDMTDMPKCLRVELRFDEVNDDESLDDNASYRIYFSSDQQKAAEFDRDNYENLDGSYEENQELLKTFMPIIRNSHYVFHVNGINQGDIRFEVRRPEERTVDIPAFN